MIELTLLGLQTVRASDGRELDSLAAQPKRFALLAYLAIAGGGGYHRRDALTVMFWPELDQFAARRALRNTLYHLREAIGGGVLISRGDDALAIDPASLTCDVTKLATALAECRYEEAVDLYRGELLAGVHFSNAGEAFEEWLSRERARTVALVLRALGALAGRDEAAGNYAAALRWTQRACALAPDDESWLRRSMSLFDAADDRGSALRLYESFERRIAAEFNSKPTGESAGLASRIREGERSLPASGTRVSSAPPSSAVPPDATGPVVEASLLGSSAPVSISRALPPPESRTSTRRSFKWVWALFVAVLVVMVTVGTRASRTHSSAPTRGRVLVVAFDNRTGDPKYESLGRMAEDWLTQGLLRMQLVDVVDSRAAFVQGHAANGASIDPLATAHRTGASLLVSGSFYRTGDTILFQAGVVDVPTGRTVRAIGPIFATERAPLSALDELRSRVMSALASVVNVHDPQDFDQTGEIPPFEAYQAYLEGWDAWWHGDGQRATALFLDASHRDPAFTDAGIAVAMAASNVGECSIIDSVSHAFDVAAQHLDRIQRLSLEIAVARCHGRNDEMLRLTLERAELAPRTSGLRMSAAAAAGWANQPKRALEIYEHIDPQTDLAWSTDSSHYNYWGGITSALHKLGNHREELKYAERMPSVAPLTSAWLRGIALAALRRPEEALAMVDTAVTLQTEPTIDIGLAPYTSGRPAYSSTPAWIAVWIARELAVHGDSAASRKAASRALDWYRGRTTQERSTVEERLVAVWALELMRSYPEAEQMLRALID